MKLKPVVCLQQLPPLGTCLAMAVIGLWCFFMPALALAAPVLNLDTGRLIQKGADAFYRGDYRQAVGIFSEAINRDSTSGLAYGNRCLSELELQAYAEAIADCTLAIEKAVNSSDSFVQEAYLNRGLAHYRSGNLLAAIADYTQTLQMAPQSYRALYNRGLAHADQGAYNQALQDYQNALEFADHDAAVALIYNDAGVAYLLLGQAQDAVDALTQSLQINGDDLRALFNRGCAYHRMGNEPMALQDFKQVIALDSTYAPAYVQQGMIQAQMGKTEAAIASLWQAAKHFQAQNDSTAYQQMQRFILRLQIRSSALG
jgi:tetratricopeptide (TPR) repeat protein